MRQMLLLLVCLASCKRAAGELQRLPDVGFDEDAPASAALSSHEVLRGSGWWDDTRRLPLAQRVALPSAALIDYLRRDNARNDYVERPRAATPTPALVTDVRAAVAGLPPAVAALAEQAIAGVVLVHDLGGSAYSECLKDARGRPDGAFIVLDARVLDKPANALASWREATPFASAPGHALVARIEQDADDNRTQALRYLLLHEIAHGLACAGTIHPLWFMPPPDDLTPFPFVTLSWRVADSRYESLFENELPERRRVRFYAAPKDAMPAERMLGLYDGLSRTGLPTLYAATNPTEDFAESFANYVHVVVEQRPFQIQVRSPGQPDFIYQHCWDAPRCASKRTWLEGLLASVKRP